MISTGVAWEIRCHSENWTDCPSAVTLLRKSCKGRCSKVPKVINLNPFFTAQRLVNELESKSGMDYFTLSEDNGPAYRLDPEKMERVMGLAKRDSDRNMPWLEASEHDLKLCRRFLRRTLIHKLALGLVEAGM